MNRFAKLVKFALNEVHVAILRHGKSESFINSIKSIKS